VCCSRTVTRRWWWEDDVSTNDEISFDEYELRNCRHGVVVDDEY
jgi:hypothetical protein